MVWIEHPGTVYSTQDNVYMCVHIHSGTLIWEVWLSLATRTLSICHGIPLQTRAIVNRITSMRRGRFGFSTNPVVGKSSIALGPVWMVSYVGNTLNHIPVQFYGQIFNLELYFRGTNFWQLRFGRIFSTLYHYGDGNTKETVKRMSGKSMSKK